MIVIGVDAATGKIIKPNINKLPNFRDLILKGEMKTIELDMKPLSAAVWTSIFSGKTPKEHKHFEYMEDGEVQTREDIPVKFVWDLLEGYEVKVLNVPFVVPPYNFNCQFEPIGQGLPINEKEWKEELNRVTEKSKEILETNPDLFIVVYTLLDRIQHFHWGEPMVLDWYQKVDRRIGELVSYDQKIILCSDHGFTDRQKAETHTLPSKGGKIKGDHSKKAILITKGVDYHFERITDIFHVMKNNFLNGKKKS